MVCATCGHYQLEHGAFTYYCWHMEEDGGYCECVKFIPKSEYPPEPEIGTDADC
jgi:hypothetical protein